MCIRDSVYIVLCAVIFSTMEVMLKTVHGVFAPMQITCLRFLVGGIPVSYTHLDVYKRQEQTIRHVLSLLSVK